MKKNQRLRFGWRLLIGFLLAMGLALGYQTGQQPAEAEANTLTTNTTHTLGFTVVNPCTGEMLWMSGEFHTLFHVTFDPTGGTHVEAVTNPQGIAGVGLTSGITYRGVGVSRTSTNITGSPGFETTRVNFPYAPLSLVSQGGDDNLLVHVVVHLTLTPGGEFTSRFEHASITCR